MKKLLALLFLSTLLSCSSDDSNEVQGIEENPQETTDPIIGEWQFGEVLYYQEGEVYEEREPTECDLMSSYTFTVGNNIILKSFIENSSGNGCEEEAENLNSFTWENLSNGEYEIFSEEIDGTQNNREINISFPEEDVMLWKESSSQFNPETEETVEILVENYFNKI
tara:strand:+ start:1829 stop:2329 length:501 start_codon:yes stop_codon:yes gene_type:complete